MVKRSDYIQINSAPDEEDEEEEDGEESSPFPTQIELPSTTTTTTMNNDNNNESSSSTTKLQPSHKLHKNPSATALHVDELFNKWTKTIAEKVHIKNNNKGRNKNKVGVRVIEDRDRDLKIEIMASVFEVWVKKDDGDLKGKGKELNENEMMMTLDHLDPMSRETFDL